MFKYVDLINIGMEMLACVMKELPEYLELVDHVHLDHSQILIKQIVSVKIEIKFLFLLKVLVLTALKTHSQILLALNAIVY